VRLKGLEALKRAACHAGVQPLDKGFEILQTLRAVRMDDEECFETATLGLLSELTHKQHKIAISIQRVVHGKRPNFESDRFLQAGRPRKRTDWEPTKDCVRPLDEVFRPLHNGIDYILLAVDGNDLPW